MNHLREYLASQRIAAHIDEISFPGANHFYSLLMSAIREADTNNLCKLDEVFPEIVKELQLRYNAPGGALNEIEMEFVQAWFAETETENDRTLTWARKASTIV